MGIRVDDGKALSRNGLTIVDILSFRGPGNDILISCVCRVTTVPSFAPKDSILPSGEKATCSTASPLVESVATHGSSPVLYTRTVRFAAADAMYFPHRGPELRPGQPYAS